MPQLFGRSPRSGRATSLKAASLSGRLIKLLKDRSVLVRLGIALLGIAGFMFAVRAWQPIFPYRVGDRVQRGVLAREDFQEVNRDETERAQLEQEELVPYVFRNDPSPLAAMPARLRTHLGAVASAGSLVDLSPEARDAFGLSASEDEQDTEQKVEKTPESRFEDLRSSIAGAEAVGMELDQIQDDFDQFLEPLREFGVADLVKLEAEELIGGARRRVALDHAIEIEIDPKLDTTAATLNDVLVPETMKDTGRLGTRWTSFPRLSAIRGFLETWMLSELPSTLHFDSEATQSRRRIARETVGERFDSYPAGDVLVKQGAVLEPEDVRLLRLEHEAVVAKTPGKYEVLRGTMAFLMFAVLVVLFGSYLHRSQSEIFESPTRLCVFFTLCVGTVWLSRAISADPWRAEVVPLLAAVIILAIAYDQVLATLTAFVLSIIISLATVATIEHFMVLMVVSVVAIVPISGVSSRSSLIKTGLLVAAVYFAVSWAAGVIRQGSDIHFEDWNLVVDSLRGAGWCLICCFLVSGTLPFIESRFGIVTDMTLLELSDVSHPLLQELVRRAPGTYNHSMSVATIGEAAAEAIGANGLLVRVGAYYHDIGKMEKPEYFIENASAGEGNRHDSLAPAMSTLIIIGHVKDGVSLAKEHNLPQQLIDFIAQHHGTTLVEYFYHEATRQADEDHKSDAEEANFRYPGPKPQTKEAGIMMLTDAVESASRTLSEPTPKRIENLVHEITMKRLHDGQFDECNVTLSEIHKIEDSLTKSLIAVYHGRVKYPEQRSA